MSVRPPSAVAYFVQAWTPELVKSIEMFTGAAPTVEMAADQTRTIVVGEPMTWFVQPFERGAAGRLRVGLPAAAVATLMAPIGDDPDEQAAMLQELLGESLRGAAHVLGTQGCRGLACAGPLAVDAAAGAGESETVWLACGGEWVRFEVEAGEDFAALLEAEDDEAPMAAPIAASAPGLAAAEPDPVLGSSFERFSGVDLPMAIVLGRATMCIRDVLKLGVGSLIELDRHVNDPVEVCVNDAVIARGQVVSIRGNYGVRVLEVLTQRERMLLRSGSSRPAGPGADRPQVH